MKVLLVFPPGGFSSKEPLPSLGLISLAAVLEREGFDVEVLDAAAAGISWRRLESALRESEADVAGITCLTEFRFESFRAARLVRKALPKAKIVIGGPHVTFCADDVLAHVPEIDAVVRGEGDIAFLNLIRRMAGGERPEDVEGVTFRRNGEIVSSPPQALVRDLDALPFPARHLLSMERYRFTLDVPDRGRHTVFHLMTSRGCPFGCSFCETTEMMGKKWRRRSPENVLEEIGQLIRDYGARVLWFYDDTFNMDKGRVMEICDLILEKNLDIRFTCSLRVDLADRELLEKMKEAGCFMVFYGVESGSQRILDRVCGKKIHLEQVREVSRILDELEIKKNPGYIIGFPDETYEDARMTLDLIREIGGKASLSLLRIYPGTAIERIARERGILPPDFSWSREEDQKRLSIPAAHGSAPIFLDTLRWDDLSRLTAEWVEMEGISLWKRVPSVLKGLRSWDGVKKTFVFGKNYLARKVKKGE